MARQCDLITRPQALSAGMTDAALRSRLRAGGPWTAVLPGVYFVPNGMALHDWPARSGSSLIRRPADA